MNIILNYFCYQKKKKKGQITTIEEDNQMNGQL